MSLYTQVCFVILGYFFSSIIVLNTCVCKKLEGYKFPVYSTKFCPRNESEWNKRSSALNCNETNGYTCLPNGKLTELLEFCHTKPFIWIQEGVCLSLKGKGSRFGAYNCSHFTDGCHNNSYQSSRIFDYPACITIGNGCFLADQSCKSSSNGTSGIDKNDCVWVLIVISIVVVVCFSSFMLYVYRKRKFSSCKRGNDIKNTSIELEELNILIADTENVKNDISKEPYKCIGSNRLDDFEENVSFTANAGTDKKDFSYEVMLESSSYKRGNDIEGTINETEERQSLIADTKNVKSDFSTEQSAIEKAMFNQWKQDDFCFISTKACEEVETNVKSRNLVIVAGHSGSGKSAIIQHIALKYREQGWTVKRVKEVEEIVDEYSSSQFQKNKTICVVNDPFGKESFDEILNNSWQKYEEELKLYLEKAKLLMSCRSHTITDSRLARYLTNQSHIVDIDNTKNKLSVDEKRQILTKYTFGMNLSDKECDAIVEVERHFPLLCKLYSSNKDNKVKGIGFFTEPVTVLKDEILGFRKKDKDKYCALALLVLFNDSFCVSDPLKSKDTEINFKHTLKLCGLKKNTPPFAIGDALNSLKGFFVKKIGDTYHFYHDFVMEVTTHVFGTDYPAEMIKCADIGFLRRRVRLGDCEKQEDRFTIYLSDKYIMELGERLFNELFGERLLNVVLNPCLRNEKVINVLEKKIADHSENIKMFQEIKKLTIDKQELDGTSNKLFLSKPSFLKLENEVSPLFALIAFCHTQLSQYCLNTLQLTENDFITMFPAVCCNGSIELFRFVFKDQVKESLSMTWGGLCPIHIVSVFHNYELLNELIKINVNVNQKTDRNGGWTPLLFAAGNDTKDNRNYNHDESGETRRDKTVHLLLSNAADINLCMEDGASPLFIACQKGHDSTVQLLLSHGAEVNLCREDGASPLQVACKNGHDSIVQRLVSKGAAINLCMKDGASPIYLACHNGHGSTLQILLNNGADINLCMEGGTNPLFIACFNGHDSAVKLLLSHGADVNLCRDDGASPLLAACQNGHDHIVMLLLDKGADIDLCKKDGTSPLTIACHNGQEKTVQLLLSRGADVNLCFEGEAGPLQAACQEGHENTVQLLLRQGADVNFCREDGLSPLYVACQNGHDSTVQLLLGKGADVNLCRVDGSSPLYIACQNGHDSTVQLLLSKGADLNVCMDNGVRPLHIACQNGHDNTVQLLLSKGADVNICMDNGVSPLHIACQNGHESTVQLLLRKGADVNLCREDGTSPLYIACYSGYESIVQLLLVKGADIKLCMKSGQSPLFIACKNGHDSIVQLLLSNSADTYLCMKNKVSPLFVACQNGHDSIVQFLLSKGADINLCIENGASPLYIACQKGHGSTVQLLLSKGADINLCTEDNVSPLHVACEKGYDSMVQILLSRGADVNLCKKKGTSPLYIACQNGHDSTVQLLLSKGADINFCMEDGASPLYVACQNGHKSIVDFLLSKDADINLCREGIASPLHIACHNGHDSTVQLLLNNGAGVNLGMEGGVSPLHLACNYGYDSTVQLLLSQGADVNLCTEYGASPLNVACQYGHDSTVQLLLSNAADTNLCMKDKISPLCIACQSGNDSIVQLLLSHGAEINLCRKDGGSPLFIACQNGHDSTVQLLLSHGAEVNLCREDGVSPLFIACQIGHDRTVKLLLSKGADVNLFTLYRASPLLIACQCGHDATVQLLLDYGADINLCNKDEVSALYIAFAWRQYKTVNILLQRNADTSLSSGLNPSYLDLFDKNDSTINFLLQRDNIYNNVYDPDSYFSLFVFCHVERMSRELFRKVYEH